MSRIPGSGRTQGDDRRLRDALSPSCRSGIAHFTRRTPPLRSLDSGRQTIAESRTISGSPEVDRSGSEIAAKDRAGRLVSPTRTEDGVAGDR